MHSASHQCKTNAESMQANASDAALKLPPGRGKQTLQKRLDGSWVLISVDPTVVRHLLIDSLGSLSDSIVFRCQLALLILG